MMVKSGENLEWFTADANSAMSLPIAEKVSAGFPSPAEEYIELTLDLNKALVKNPGATFYARVKGTSMQDAGIHDGDILIVDKSLAAGNGKKAVCFIDGEFTLKTLKIENDTIWLIPANSSFKPIAVTEDNDFTVWGIVTYVIKKM
ncbi:MAG: translesion error-prone DNA polymerase V autoproteolytic subunit [Bacteroidota bacterium]